MSLRHRLVNLQLPPPKRYSTEWRHRQAARRERWGGNQRKKTEGGEEEESREGGGGERGRDEYEDVADEELCSVCGVHRGRIPTSGGKGLDRSVKAAASSDVLPQVWDLGKKGGRWEVEIGLPLVDEYLRMSG